MMLSLNDFHNNVGLFLTKTIAKGECIEVPWCINIMCGSDVNLQDSGTYIMSFNNVIQYVLLTCWLHYPYYVTS